MMFFAASNHLSAEQYEYDAQGGLTAVTCDDGVSITYTYDEARNLIESDITETEYFTVVLEQGWDLISVSMQPEDTSIDSVLLPIKGKYKSVWAYYSKLGWLWYFPEQPSGGNL